MANPIEAHPNCNVVATFLKEYGVGNVGAKGILRCPVIDRSDPDRPVSQCVLSVLRNMGATKIDIVEGTCPNNMKGLKADIASKN